MFGSIFGDPISDSLASMQAVLNQFTGSITNPTGVVQAYQAAGNTAVGQIGPAIDALSGSNPNVMKMTQWAWSKNGQLAGYTDDVVSARAALQQMLTWYQQAYRLAQSQRTAAPASAPAYSAPVAAPHPLAPAPLMPTGPSPLAPALGHAKITSAEIFATSGGGAVGLIVGARVAGLALGGPFGFIIGASAGFLLSKALKV